MNYIVIVKYIHSFWSNKNTAEKIKWQTQFYPWLIEKNKAESKIAENNLSSLYKICFTKLLKLMI